MSKANVNLALFAFTVGMVVWVALTALFHLPPGEYIAFTWNYIVQAVAQWVS